MELDYIDDLISVVKSKSYNKAALERNISTPGLKKRIQKIDQYFGYKLFDANSKGVSLTSDGLKLYEGLLSLKQQIELLKNQDMDTLKVGIISNFPLDKLYKMNNKNERIRLYPANSTKTLIDKLQQEELDLVIGEQIELQEGIYYEYWFEEPYELVFSKHHKLNHTDHIDNEDLAKQHYYLLEPPGDTFNFEDYDIKPNQMNLSYVKDRESILNFIATSESVAICPQSYMSKVNSDMYTHVQLPNASRAIGIYAKKPKYINDFHNVLNEK
ncbi:LysR family transcriptional regulator [Staphylococcus sp. EG-SA-13]|nr:LysR family transcriptional regulator [Staphylococcus sp. EG-SA-13]